MTGTDELVRALAERVTALEDKLAILELMTAYGPAIDSGSADAVARLWTEDGVYDVDTGVMRGHAAITAMVQSQAHQAGSVVAARTCSSPGTCASTVTPRWPRASRS